MKILGRLLLVFIPLFLFITRQSSAQTPLERKIVIFRPEVTFEDKIKLLTHFQAIFGKELKLINGMAIRLPKGMAEKLFQERGILRVDPDVEVYALPGEFVSSQSICDWFPNWKGCNPTPTPTSTPTPFSTPTPTPIPTQAPVPTSTPTPEIQSGATSQVIPWGVSRISATSAWNLTRGQGIKVAILDTGVDRDHPDLRNNLAGCHNFINTWKSCEDDNGHGTHVSGIIAALDNNFGVVGVAPLARIYSLKVLNRQGGGYLSDILEGLDWAIQNKMQIINLSLGTNTDVASFREAVIKVNQAGIVQVAAGGNSGPGENTVSYPAKYPEVIAVSAVDSSGNVPYWSSRGPEVDLAAPGVNINSTYLSGKYQNFSGTSMATPHVTGVVALRLFLHPTETPSQLKSILEAQTDAIAGGSNLVGAGLINAYKVVTAP